jgi:hypothetical protein
VTRTRKQTKAPGYEYWGRRPASSRSPGRYTKTTTHRAERRMDHEEIERQLAEEKKENDRELAEVLAAEEEYADDSDYDDYSQWDDFPEPWMDA